MGNQIAASHDYRTISAATAALSSSCTTFNGSPSSSQKIATVVHVVDGRSIEFQEPIKAIHVLLNHPHHCICPAKSLLGVQLDMTMTMTGSAGRLNIISNYNKLLNLKACSLLPDDELELGHLYLLLPFDMLQLLQSGHHSWSGQERREEVPKPIFSRSNSSPPLPPPPRMIARSLYKSIMHKCKAWKSNNSKLGKRRGS